MTSTTDGKITVKGYDVITTDGKKVGRIAAVTGDFYVVERGTMWKTRSPLHKRFASVDEDTRTIRAGISSQVLLAGPKVGRDGIVDKEERTTISSIRRSEQLLRP